MKQRAALVLGLILTAWFWTSAARADILQAEENPSGQPESELLLTNTADLVGLFLEGYTYPLGSWVWTPTEFQPMTIVWADTSNLPAGLAGITNFVPTSVSGVPGWPLWVTLWPQSNTVTVLQPWSDGVLTEFSVPDGFPSWQVYERNLSASCTLSGINYTNWETLVEEGCTQFSVPQVVAHAWLMELGNQQTYWNNVEADWAAAEAATASAAGMCGRFMSMDDEDPGDGGGDPPEPDGTGIDPVPSASPPPINLLQPFTVTAVQPTGQGVRITWQSAQWSRYIVWCANDLSSNTVWFPQAYVWGATNMGATNVGLTSYTDPSSTNLTHRFYKVQRLLGSSIAAGGTHSLAMTPDGKLWSWGNNSDGELSDGLGDNGFDSTRPYPGEAADPTSCTGQFITNAVALAGGGNEFTVVADVDGTVWAAGEDRDGEQGSAPGYYDNEDHFPATAISGVSNVVNVAAGHMHVLALRADGTVFAWGSDEDSTGLLRGQLGVGGLASGQTNAPIQSTNLTQIVAISAGAYHSVALDSSNRVWTWGAGDSGQLGNGGTADVKVPTVLTTISNVIAIGAGYRHTIALTADKTLWTWGDNQYGELGRTNVSVGYGSYDASPGQIPPSTLSNVVAIAAGADFSLAVTGDGYIHAWGDGSAGELGVSGITSTNIPIQVPGISNAVLVSATSGDPSDGEQSAAEKHVVAMTLDPVDGTGQTTNRYWGWGDNSDGAVGNGTNQYNSGSSNYQTTPAQVQFCTRCQRCVQLGTGGVFTAQCNGTLHLYFNTDQTVYGVYGTNSYSVIFHAAGETNLLATVMGDNSTDVSVGTVTNGGVYFFTASGFCQYNIAGNLADPNGEDPSGQYVGCSSINVTNTICPTWRCFSLVGKIQ